MVIHVAPASNERDGWVLVSAEERHQLDPENFLIPEYHERESLVRGDAAKLLFDIVAKEGDEVLDRGVDRMWVIVISRVGDKYRGVLDSDPGISPGLALRPGTEILFDARNVCDIDRPPDAYLLERFGPRFLDP